MDKESIQKLQFDRRLRNRPGHIGAADFASHLESLPDLSDKVATDEDVDPAPADAPVTAPE